MAQQGSSQSAVCRLPCLYPRRPLLWCSPHLFVLVCDPQLPLFLTNNCTTKETYPNIFSEVVLREKMLKYLE